MPLASSQTAPWSFTDETATRLSSDPNITEYTLATLGTLTANNPSNPALGEDSEADVAVGDFDNDGWMDIAVVRKAPVYQDYGRRNVLLMNRNGVLTDETVEFAPEFRSIHDRSRDIQAFDSDGDGFLDLIIANTQGDEPEYYENLGLDSNNNWRGFRRAEKWFTTECLNNAFGDDATNCTRFPQFSPSPIANGAPLGSCAVAVGDVNMDGLPDIYFGAYDNSCAGDCNRYDRLLINQGKHGFFEETSLRIDMDMTDAFTSGAQIFDSNGDGFPEILRSAVVIAGPNGVNAVEIAYNDGTGCFRGEISAPEDSAGTGVGTVYMTLAGDYDNDGNVDIYYGADSGNGSQFGTGIDPNCNPSLDCNTGQANYCVDEFLGYQSDLTANFFSANIIAVDFDGDGNQELVVTGNDGQGVQGGSTMAGACGTPTRIMQITTRFGVRQFFEPPPPGGFGFATWRTGGVWDSAVLDLDNDGDYDMVHFSCAGINVLMQD